MHSESVIRGFAGGGRKAFIAGWGLAKLVVTSDEIRVRAESGEVRFTPKEVVSIEPHVLIRRVYWGIEIHHNRRTVVPRVLFFGWPWHSPEAILAMIRERGFVAQGSDDDWSD